MTRTASRRACRARPTGVLAAAPRSPRPRLRRRHRGCRRPRHERFRPARPCRLARHRRGRSDELAAASTRTTCSACRRWITDEQVVSYLGAGLIARALVRTRPFGRGDEVRVVSTDPLVAEMTAAWARSLGARIVDAAADVAIHDDAALRRTRARQPRQARAGRRRGVPGDPRRRVRRGRVPSRAQSSRRRQRSQSRVGARVLG